MKNLKDKKAFSIVIAIWLVLVMNLLVLYILEYMVPYSKNVKWIENSSNAFYQAENSIEEWLYFFSTRWTWTIKEFADKTKPFSSWSWVTYKYSTTSSWNTIPYNWEWNSEYDSTFNKISQWDSIQLKVWKWVKINWSSSSTKIFFQVPTIWSSTTLSWWSLPIINWQLSSDTGNWNTLNAKGSWITANDIDWTDININNFQWVDLNWNEDTIYMKFWKYYEDHCYWTNSWCTLKFSIINKLELDNTEKTPIPYLEYKFILNSTKKVPLRYSRIKASWKSYGFQKNLEVRVPQQTTNEAFDFTVFQ